MNRPLRTIVPQVLSQVCRRCMRFWARQHRLGDPDALRKARMWRDRSQDQSQWPAGVIAELERGCR